MSTNPFNRAEIEQQKQWARWLAQIPPADSPDAQDGKNNSGTKDDDMNAFELADKIAVDAQSVVEGATSVKSEITKYGDEKYNEGVEAGKKMIQIPDPTNPDNIYTQVQMNEAVTAGKAQQRSEDESEFGAKISELQGQIDGIPAQLDSAKSEAKAELKSEIKAAYEAQQVAETQGETGFSDLLK